MTGSSLLSWGGVPDITGTSACVRSTWAVQTSTSLPRGLWALSARSQPPFHIFCNSPFPLESRSCRSASFLGRSGFSPVTGPLYRQRVWLKRQLIGSARSRDWPRLPQLQAGSNRRGRVQQQTGVPSSVFFFWWLCFPQEPVYDHLNRSAGTGHSLLWLVLHKGPDGGLCHSSKSKFSWTFLPWLSNETRRLLEHYFLTGILPNVR